MFHFGPDTTPETRPPGAHHGADERGFAHIGWR